MRIMRGAALLAVPLAVVLAATACDGLRSGKKSSTGKTTQPSGHPPLIDWQSASPDQVKDGGTLRWGIATFGPQWNINQVNGAGTGTGMADVMYSVMPEPTITDVHANYTFDPAYWLSVKVVSTSPQKVEYKLNPKAKWSDGTPMTVADFKAQWLAMNGKNSKFHPAFTIGYENISDVSQGRDKFDVIVTYAQPFAEWASLFNPLYPAKAQATPKAFDNMYNDAIPITGGAFKFKAFDTSARTVTVVRDPNWWGDNKPKLDAIVFKTLDSTAAHQAFADGELDVDRLIANVGSEYKRAASSKSGHVYASVGLNQRQFTFHNGGILADINVRKAIAMGTDRIAFAKAELAGLPVKSFATLDNHIFVLGQTGYQNNAGTVGKYNPAAAKKMLDDAGWKVGSNGYRSKNGQELDVTFTVPSGTASSAMEGRLMQPMMQAIGVKLIIETVPSQDLFTKYVIPGNFDIAPFTWVGTAFPGSGAVGIYVTKGGQNYTGMSDPVIDQDFNDALSSLDLNVYRAKLNDADAHIWDEVHSLMLFQRLDLEGVANNVVNYGALGFQSVDYTKIGFKK